MPTPNAQKHATASTQRTHLFTFHLSVQNKHPKKYITDVDTVIVHPSTANEVKSTASNTNNTADHKALGANNRMLAQDTGNKHANTTSTNNSEKIKLIKGTKIQFNNNAHPDT